MKKTKTLTIQRRKVIQALRTEPLKEGDFFHLKGYISVGEKPADRKYNYGAPYEPDCQVCAVGGIIRKHLSLENKTYEDLLSLAKIVTKGEYALGDRPDVGNHLGKLSVFFEERMTKTKKFKTKSGLVSAYGRKKLVEFVKKTFPKQFRVQL